MGVDGRRGLIMVDVKPTRDGRVVEWFGGEERLFHLTVPWLAKVQDDTGVGPAVVIGALARLAEVLEHRGKVSDTSLLAAGMGDWKVDYIRRPIFWGLVGGGMTPNDAGKLVATWIDDRGFMGLVENGLLALRVMVGATEAPREDTLGESVAAAAATPPKPRRSRSRKAASASQSSTKTPRPQASRPPRSTAAPSGRSLPRSTASTGPTSPTTGKG